MDDKQRKLLIITLILVPVFILTLVNSIIKMKQRYKPAANSSTPALDLQALPTAQTSKAASVNPTEQKKEDLDWIRCPFCGKIYSGREGGPIDLKLTGIVWDEKKPQALINDLIVKEGDSVGHFRVIKIFRDKVQLGSDNGAYFEIRLAK